MKKLILFGLVLVLWCSCKPKAVYDEAAYEAIMNKSIKLHAYQQKGRNPYVKANGFSDTLYANDKLPKEMVDSINTARKLEYRKAGF